MNRKKIIIFIVFSCLFSYVPHVHSIGAPEKLTDKISYPLPTLPAAVLQEGFFKVELHASNDASDWAGSITSRFASTDLVFTNSSYSNGLWRVYFQIPVELPAELYDLTVTFNEGGDAFEYSHSRCVWVLDSWPETLTISHITDLHLQHGRDPTAEYIHQVNLMDADIIIATGDIVQTETVAVGWSYLHQELSWLDIPSYLLPGNHDHAGGDSVYYQQYCGPLNYTLVLGDFVIITLDSQLDGVKWANQFQWVESELNKYPEKVKIMAWHHPFFGSEYETDLGSVKGGSFTGSSENISELSDILYPSWMVDGQPSNAAKEMLRVIEENDVRLILCGHVHRDLVYILNDRHYFVTTGPVGGGLVPTMYHSSRLIDLDSDGNLTMDLYATNKLFDPPNSIPVDGVYYWYSSDNDYSGSAVSATVDNNLEMSLEEARLEFHVSSEYSVNDYQYTVAPERSEVYTVDDGYIFIAYYDIPAKDTFYVSLYASGDSEDPELVVDIPEVTSSESLSGTISVSDSGWGIMDADVWYLNDETVDWVPLDISFKPTINGDVYDVTYPEISYTFTIPEEQVTTGLELKVEASDYAGNSLTYTTDILTAPELYTLSIDANPTGITININGTSETAPYSGEFEEGTITLSVSEEVELIGKTYTFQGWADGSTSTERTLTIEEDVSLTANFEEKEEPSGGIPLPTEYAIVGLLVVLFLLAKKK